MKIRSVGRPKNVETVSMGISELNMEHKARLEVLKAVMKQYTDANLSIPAKYTDEYNQIVLWIKVR